MNLLYTKLIIDGKGFGGCQVLKVLGEYQTY